MAYDEYQALVDSVSSQGVLNPITLFDGAVLDGWHRYSAATELGMDCPAVELGDDIDPRDFVLAMNKERRNLTASQRANAVTAVYQWHPAHRPNKSAVTAELSKTTKELAAIAGVGTRTIEQAKAVHAGAVPEVQDAVQSGAVSVEVAAAVAKLPAKDQVMLAAKGPDAMRATLKGGNVTSPQAPAAKPAAPALTEKQARELENSEAAHGEDNPAALLEAAYSEADNLRALLSAAEADDKQAEVIKWRRKADIALRRQNELMDTVNSREKELQSMANWLRRVGRAVGEDDHARAVCKVEAKFRESRALMVS